MTPAAESGLLFAVVVPSLGDGAKLGVLLESLAGQTLPRDRWELCAAVDGTAVDAALRDRVVARGGRAIVTGERGGPGRARNLGAAATRGPILAFTEDDCAPSPDWLERAAERFAAEPELDVLEGATLKPGGRPVRLHADEAPAYLPTNLFVRRSAFERAGGYCEGYFDPETNVYFREDSDLGFTLEALGARIGREPRACVTHPPEHPRFLDPLRWARRYEMDALLRHRHPRRFAERIEVHRLGPLRLRRPIVRACGAYALSLLGAAVSALAGTTHLTGALLALAALAILPVWAKWRFDPVRLPVVLLVPLAMILALARGRARLGRLTAAPG